MSVHYKINKNNLIIKVVRVWSKHRLNFSESFSLKNVRNITMVFKQISRVYFVRCTLRGNSIDKDQTVDREQQQFSLCLRCLRTRGKTYSTLADFALYLHVGLDASTDNIIHADNLIVLVFKFHFSSTIN